MSKFFRILFWFLGIAILVPTLFAAWTYLSVMHLKPWRHERNVERMDAKNDSVWKAADATVVGLETYVSFLGETQSIASNVVCYEGYSAKAWTLKDGGPSAGPAPRSVGEQAIEEPLSDEAILFIGLRNLCRNIFRLDDVQDFVDRLQQAEVVVPAQGLYCREFSIHNGTPFLFRSSTVEASRPRVTSVTQRPLRDVASREAMGSSRVPSCIPARCRRFGPDLRRSDWEPENTCRNGKVGGLCNPEMTRICGAPVASNPAPAAEPPAITDP